MVRIADIVVSETILNALAAISRYSYLSVNQVATITGLRPKSASEMLLRLERQKLLSSFGNTGIRGYGKTPKVYYLTKGGYRLFAEEAEALCWDVAPYRPANVTSRWSPQMFHRLDTLDAMAALERDCESLQSYRLVKTLVEYRRERVGRDWRKETTDYVDDRTIAENKIVPDAGFVLESKDTGKRALFLIEIDCGTERLTTAKPESVSQSFIHKLHQYDRYLLSKRVTARYKHLGDFAFFRVLTITTSHERIDNMRRKSAALVTDLDQYFRFSTQAEIKDNFLHSGWRSRSNVDESTYPLIRGT